MSVQQEKFAEIADAIRAKTGETDLIKPSDFADKVGEVYEAGEQAEYDRFWDAYQNNGNRTNYSMAFAESGSSNDIAWKVETTYRPKYPLKPRIASQMYYCTRLPYEALKEVKFSDCTDFLQTFAYSPTEHLGVIDMSKATRTSTTFLDCKQLHTIDKIIVSQTTPYNNPFAGVTNLQNLIIEGPIGKNGFNISASTLLTHDSLMSIINELYNYSKDTSGTSWVCTLGTENLAKLTDAEKAIATEKGWTLA